MESASYPPYYGGSTPFSAGTDAPVRGHHDIPRGQSDWSQNLVLPGLSGLGRVGLGQVRQPGQNDWLFTASTLAGAAVGGGLVGWVAGKKSKDGAQRGALFSVGLTSVADGFSSWRHSPTKGAILVGGGLAGLWWVLRKL